MKSRASIPVALLLVVIGVACATVARSEPDPVRITHACVVSPDGRPRALSPQALAPRLKPALSDTNHLHLAFDSPDDPWTPTELVHLQSYVETLLPILEEVCGPPSAPDAIEIIKDRSLADEGIAGTYTPTEHAIRLVQADRATLCHELAHAFHGDDVVYWDPFEEGMAVAVTAQVLERLHVYAQPYGDSDDASYDLLNQPAISPHRGFFWSGLPAVVLRYELAGYVWRKAALEHPGFQREFNRRYYEALAASDTLRHSIGGLIAIAAEVAPEMEGMRFRAWADRQYVLGTTPQLGVQIYQFGFSPLVVLFFRHADGYEEPLPGEDLAWRASDGEDVAAGAGVWPTDFGGGVFLYPQVPPLSRGSLTVEASASTRYGSQSSAMTRPLAGGKGLYGVVRGAHEGTLTITPLGQPLPPETVPVRWGAFDAPGWRRYAGQLELAFTDPDGRRAARIVTKDSTSYLAILDAPAGPVSQPAAVFTARPSVATVGCRFALNHAVEGPSVVTLYAVNGRALRAISVPAGARAVDWDGLGSDGLFVSAGVYVARLTGPGVDARTRFVVTH